MIAAIALLSALQLSSFSSAARELGGLFDGLGSHRSLARTLGDQLLKIDIRRSGERAPSADADDDEADEADEADEPAEADEEEDDAPQTARRVPRAPMAPRAAS